MIRINRFIAQCTDYSRRAAEKLILDKKIRLNGEVITDLGRQIDPESDIVTLDGRTLRPQTETMVVALNKPRGYLTTKDDPYGRPIVMELLPQKYQHLFPVGRLDQDTEGLLLFTNDGQLANQITHPRYEHDKQYEVIAVSNVTAGQLAKLEQGIQLDNKITAPAQCEKTNPNRFTIVIHEGRQNQIRRMCAHVGIEIDTLRRIRIQDLELSQLGIKLGQIKLLSTNLITKLA